MDTKDKSKIDEEERRLIKAMKQSNVADLSNLLHDDLLFVIPTGDTLPGHMQIDSLTTDDKQINVFDSNSVVSVNVHLRGSFFNQSIDGTFKYIRV